MSRPALIPTDAPARRRWQRAWMVISAIWATITLGYGYSLWKEPIPNVAPTGDIRCEALPAIATSADRAAAPPPAARPVNPYDVPVNPYDEIGSAMLDEQNARQREALRRAAEAPPDRAAEVRRLAARTGLPESVVERNFDDMVKQLAERISKPGAERIEELSKRFMVPREAIERSFEIYERAANDERRNLWSDIDSPGELYRDLKQQACDLHEVTGLPAGFVYDHLSTLRQRMRKDGFSAEAFRQGVIRAAEESREAALRRQREEAVIASVALSTGPPVALFFLGHSVAWGIRRRSKQAWPSRVATLRIAAYVSFAGAFVCFWVAAAEDLEPPFTEEQWRLLGWTLLAAATAITWRQRTPSFSAPAEPITGRVSSPIPLPKSDAQEMGAHPRVSHTTWRCPVASHVEA